jgi:hypothetical protein
MKYVPAAIPNDTAPALKAWLADELRRISADQLSHTPTVLQMQPQGVEPARPRNGMLVYADGTAWDPGSGEGFYGYEAGAWVKL